MVLSVLRRILSAKVIVFVVECSEMVFKKSII